MIIWYLLSCVTFASFWYESDGSLVERVDVSPANSSGKEFEWDSVKLFQFFAESSRGIVRPGFLVHCDVVIKPANSADGPFTDFVSPIHLCYFYRHSPFSTRYPYWLFITLIVFWVIFISSVSLLRTSIYIEFYYWFFPLFLFDESHIILTIWWYPLQKETSFRGFVDFCYNLLFFLLLPSSFNDFPFCFQPSVFLIFLFSVVMVVELVIHFDLFLISWGVCIAMNFPALLL